MFKDTIPENMTGYCAFWNYTEGVWSTDGCLATFGNDSQTHCTCNHLTNFAILISRKPAVYII